MQKQTIEFKDGTTIQVDVPSNQKRKVTLNATGTDLPPVTLVGSGDEASLSIEGYVWIGLKMNKIHDDVLQMDVERFGVNKSTVSVPDGMLTGWTRFESDLEATAFESSPMWSVHMGLVIQKTLDSLGWTHSAVAERCGVDRSTVSQWINGHSELSRKNLILVSHALAQPLSEFVASLNRYIAELNDDCDPPKVRKLTKDVAGSPGEAEQFFKDCVLGECFVHEGVKDIESLSQTYGVDCRVFFEDEETFCLMGLPVMQVVGLSR